MTVINEADALYLGAAPVDAVYVGSQKVWPVVHYGPEEYLYPFSETASAPADPNTFMVGNQFHSTVDGIITGIKYYRHAGSATSRPLGLWLDDGTLLFSATTSGEVNGWNVYPIDPIDITAFTSYRVAYGYAGSAAAGYFAFNMTAVSGSTHLVQTAGVYTTPVTSGGDDDFPNNTINPNHYYCDIVFQGVV